MYRQDVESFAWALGYSVAPKEEPGSFPIRFTPQNVWHDAMTHKGGGG
jgi:hypothetical protein